MKVALADISQAPDLPAAAKGVGRLAGACASCHTAESVGTAGRPVWNTPPTRIPEMARHGRAVDQLWIALIGGSDADLKTATAQLDQAAGADAASAIDKRSAELAHAVTGKGDGYGELLAMCATCHAANRPRAVPKIDGVPLPNLQPAMDDHFVHALELQLAVMGGELDAAHRAGAALAEAPAPENLPEAAKPYVAAIAAIGDRASTAPTLADAAKASADLVVACAACHTASGGGPKDEIPAPPVDDKHMGMHLYGAYWLGYGLFAPDERAWQAGAKALSTAKLLPDGAAPGADAAVHDLAKKALATTDTPARAALWADLLQSCEPCHEQLKK